LQEKLIKIIIKMMISCMGKYNCHGFWSHCLRNDCQNSRNLYSKQGKTGEYFDRIDGFEGFLKGLV